MIAIIQKGCVLDEQILSRLAPRLAGALQMGGQHPVKSYAPLPKEAAGRFECGPVREGLG